MATYDLASVNAPSTTAIKTGDIINCSFCGSTKSITLPPGQYKLECWGAQGGGYSSSLNPGGKGGYSVGTLTLTANTVLYMASGGQGVFQTSTSKINSGGWNGGGQSYGTNGGRGSGGGGSDIRIGTDSINYRIIVAGGGGGNLYWSSASNVYTAGAGGGTSGQTGLDASNASAGEGGTATAGGYGEYGNGSFGQGGNVTSSSTVCGGGGGWYGGGAANPSGGGSGYVYTSSTYSNHPYNSSLGSTYYLSSANTYAGNTTFIAPGGGNETGHSGNGYTRITAMSLGGIKIYLKTASSTWKQIN